MKVPIGRRPHDSRESEDGFGENKTARSYRSCDGCATVLVVEDASQPAFCSEDCRKTYQAIKAAEQASLKMWPDITTEERMNVIKPGTKVTLRDNEELEARVVAVILCDTGVRYEVSWWNGNSREVKEFPESDVTADKKDKITLGFQP